MFKKLILATAALCAMNVASQAADFSGKSWDDIVAQAKQEGQVSWFVWYYQDDFRDVAKKFEDKYGIKVTVPAGTHEANIDKMLAEKDRAKGDIDVLALGYDHVPGLDLDRLFYSLKTLLPADDGRTWKLSGIDGAGYVTAYWGNQSGIAYDPAKVDESALPQTPEDFAKFWQANPGKFGFNYENGGSGPSFYMNTLRNLSDVDFYDGASDEEKIAALKPAFDFFNKYAEDYVITSGNADSITRISDGELWMAPAWEDHLASLQKSGEVRKDIELYIPSMGMNGGGNGIAVPQNAPHPAAALVLANWLSSAEVQTLFNTRFGTAPMHTKADDSHALVSNAQRAYRVPSPAAPFRDNAMEAFVENVILER